MITFAVMMIVLYILIGIAVGALALYFVMSPKVAQMTVELARKETEMKLQD